MIRIENGMSRLLLGGLIATFAIQAQQPPTPDPSPGGYRVGGEVSAPNLISKVEPDYTEDARKAKISGSVLLNLIVGADGVPRDITILRGLGYKLDESAINAVSQWRFRPGMRQGTPVPVHTRIEVNFRLLPDPAARAPNSIPPATAEEAYRRADRLTRDGSVAAATAMLAQAVALNPQWPQAFEAKARSEAKARAYPEAIADFTRAIELDGAKPNWYDERGLAYLSAGMTDKALADFNRCIELSPLPIPTTFFVRGRAYMKLGQTDKALVDFTKAIALSPAFADAYRNRAEAYASQRDWKHAVADRTAVLELEPSPEAYSKRAEAKRASGDEAGSQQDERKASESSPPRSNASANP